MATSRTDAGIRREAHKLVDRVLEELRALNVRECDHEGLRPDTRVGKVTNCLDASGHYSILWCSWCGAFRHGAGAWRKPGAT